MFRRNFTQYSTPQSTKRQSSMPSLLQWVVVEQLLDDIHVAEQHATTAVPRQVQGIKRITLSVVILEQLQVLLPLVTDHLAAREASNRNELKR